MSINRIDRDSQPVDSSPPFFIPNEFLSFMLGEFQSIAFNLYICVTVLSTGPFLISHSFKNLSILSRGAFIWWASGYDEPGPTRSPKPASIYD